jgi:hypothetical protein
MFMQSHMASAVCRHLALTGQRSVYSEVAYSPVVRFSGLFRLFRR